MSYITGTPDLILGVGNKTGAYHYLTRPRLLTSKAAYLTAAILVLRKTFLAVYRTVFSGFERYFTLFFAF